MAVSLNTRPQDIKNEDRSLPRVVSWFSPCKSQNCFRSRHKMGHVGILCPTMAKYWRLDGELNLLRRMEVTGTRASGYFYESICSLSRTPVPWPPTPDSYTYILLFHSRGIICHAFTPHVIIIFVTLFTFVTAQPFNQVVLITANF